MNRECKHCGSEFDTASAHKAEVGGRINECPECVEELGTETAPTTLSMDHLGAKKVAEFGGNPNHKGHKV